MVSAGQLVTKALRARWRGFAAKDQPATGNTEQLIDLWFLSAVLALLVLGTIEVFSASAVQGLKRHGDSMFFLKRQTLWLTLGVAAMAFGALVDYRWLHRYTYLLLLVSIVLLVAVLVVGTPINGAKRWFRLGPASIQPVEIAKMAMFVFLAYSLAKKTDRIKLFAIGFVPHLLVCGVMMALLLMQPDMGSATLLGATTLLMLVIAGVRISYVVLAIMAAAPIAYLLIVGTWRLQRFLAWMNPEKYIHGVGYQAAQSKIAIGSGGLTGEGLGGGKQVLGYMPEGHNDYILAIVGEELGFIGVCTVLALFGILLWRGLRAALRARDAFGCYLALGITTLLGLQALIHTGVVMAAIPAKGITLPFVSHGGSSLVVTMFLAGVILNIGKAAPYRAGKRELINHVGATRKRRRAIIVCD